MPVKEAGEGGTHATYKGTHQVRDNKERKRHIRQETTHRGEHTSDKK
jgi:demethoxyubiquinone hydroxylase (CLK1/Coq7/Cat5 family)